METRGEKQRKNPKVARDRDYNHDHHGHNTPWTHALKPARGVHFTLPVRSVLYAEFKRVNVELGI